MTSDTYVIFPSRVSANGWRLTLSDAFSMLMDVVKGLNDANQVGRCSRKNEAVEDLVRGSPDVERSGTKAFRNSSLAEVR
jgi:hypothetical protein